MGCGMETLTSVGRVGMPRWGRGRGRSGEVEEEVVLSGDVDEGERLHGRGAEAGVRRVRRRAVGKP